VTTEAKKATNSLPALPEDFIKDPYVLEFLDLPSDNAFLEKDVENAIIQKLQHFLLELGKGFFFRGTAEADLCQRRSFLYKSRFL